MKAVVNWAHCFYHCLQLCRCVIWSLTKAISYYSSYAREGSSAETNNRHRPRFPCINDTALITAFLACVADRQSTNTFFCVSLGVLTAQTVNLSLFALLNWPARSPPGRHRSSRLWAPAGTPTGCDVRHAPWRRWVGRKYLEGKSHSSMLPLLISLIGAPNTVAALTMHARFCIYSAVIPAPK